MAYGGSGSFLHLTPQTETLQGCASLWNGTAASWVNLGALLPAGQYGGSISLDVAAVGQKIIVGGSANSIQAGQASPVMWTYTPDSPGDVTGNGVVDADDLIAVILALGSCPTPPANCPGDVAPPPNGDGQVNVDDLIMVILNWG